MSWDVAAANDLNEMESLMNNSTQEESRESTKQPYQAPVLRVIELATDEVLGTGCKTVEDVVPTSVCGDSACGNLVGS